MVSECRKPVIIAGTYAIRNNLSAELNRLSLPCFSVAAAKGVIDEMLPHAAGVYTGVGLELTPEFSIIKKADLIIGIGLRHNEVLNVKPFECESINLDSLGDECCYGFGFDHILPADRETLVGLFEGLERKSWGLTEVSDQIHHMKRHLLRASFMPANVFQRIEQHFDHQVRIVLDTGNFCTIGEHIFRVNRPEYYLSAGQGRYMGIGLPLSIGASLYDPNIPTVLFSGDGGIGMFISEVKLAVQYKLPLIVILMSDGYLGSIRVRSLLDRITEKPVTIHQPSWRKVFESIDMNAITAESESDIEEILGNWGIEKGPLFIETHFDPEDYQRMTDSIR